MRISFNKMKKRNLYFYICLYIHNIKSAFSDNMSQYISLWKLPKNIKVKNFRINAVPIQY